MIGIEKVTAKLKQQEGRTSTEMLLVLVLLLLLGLSIFVLSISGTESYKKLTDQRDSLSEARVAASYLHTKIRQNDVLGSIALAENTVYHVPAIFIEEVIGDTVYRTWIYYHDGYLREALVLKDELPSDDYSIEIAALDGLEFSIDQENGIRFTLFVHKGDQAPIEMSEFIAVRSGGIR